MGENEGSQPQNVGFDDFYGFLGVSDMYSEWRDVYFNPEVALSPSRFKMIEKLDFNHYNVHCTPQQGLENTYLIDLDKIKDLDQDWAAYSERVHPPHGRADRSRGSSTIARGPATSTTIPTASMPASRPRAPCSATAWSKSTTSLGRLVKTLEETGQLDNTIIFFTSATTGPSRKCRRTAARRFAAPRARAGKGASACRRSSIGKA